MGLTSRFHDRHGEVVVLRAGSTENIAGRRLTPDVREVHAWLGDATSCRALLRIAWASGQQPPTSSDLTGVAQRLVRDFQREALRAYRVDRIGPIATLEIPDAELRSSPVVSEQEDIFNPRWSEPRVEVGTSLFAIVSYAEIKAPVSATIVIWEVDDGTTRQEIARIATTIPVGTGDHKVKWRRSPEAAGSDLEEDAASGDSGPLEYRFRVESDDPVCHEESGPLWLTNTVNVELIKELDRKKLDKHRIVVLTDAIGDERRARSKDGEVKFEKVLVGPMHLRFAAPHFTDLSWSASPVPVGEAVEAVFDYADAIKGMQALVVVYEVNRDGTSKEIDRLKVELGGPSGEARVSFTRTEDQAQHDIQEDDHEGDSGPLEYRYRVAAEGVKSELSDALWLTHTVSIKLDNTAKGKSFPEGMELVLIAADGTEHRAAHSSERVKFENVVCGPMMVKLATNVPGAAS